MQETFVTKAIILKRQAFRERDSRVTVYSVERGRLELVARGTKDIKSKLAGHIEPVSLVNLMVVRGKRFSYIGSAVAENSFRVLKSDFLRISAAGKAVKAFLNIVKGEEADEGLYKLLFDFLIFLNYPHKKALDYDLFYYFFLLKLLSAVGYRPDFYYCLEHKNRVKSGEILFNFKEGGLLCEKHNKDENSLTISDNSIKILRLVVKGDFFKLNKVKISLKLGKEIEKIIQAFYIYRFA